MSRPEKRGAAGNSGVSELEIPPEILDRAAAALLDQQSDGFHDWDEDRDLDEDGREFYRDGVRAIAPHLFSLFAERLTSDDVVEQLAREWADHDAAAGISTPWNRRGVRYQAETRREVRMFLRRAAALVPGREDGANG